MMQDESDAHSVSCSGAPPHLPSLTLGNFYKNQHLSGKRKGWLSLSTMGVSSRRVETCLLSGFWQGEWTRWPLQAYLVSAYLKGVYDPDTGHPLPQSEQLWARPKVDLCEACCGDLINSLLGISCLLPRNHLQSTRHSID